MNLYPDPCLYPEKQRTRHQKESRKLKEKNAIKKLLTVVFCVAITVSCMLLASCGDSGSSADLSDSEYVGTWVAQTIDAFGQEETTEDFSEATEGAMTLTVNGDGTFVLDWGEDEEPSSGTWEETSNGFKTRGDFKLTFKAEDGGISTSIVGAHIHFVKQ